VVTILGAAGGTAALLTGLGRPAASIASARLASPPPDGGAATFGDGAGAGVTGAGELDTGDIEARTSSGDFAGVGTAGAGAAGWVSTEGLGGLEERFLAIITYARRGFRVQ